MQKRNRTARGMLFLALSSVVLGCGWLPINWYEAGKGLPFRISLPDYLDTTSTLAPEAPFQYQNRQKDLYLAIQYFSLDSLYMNRPNYATGDYFNMQLNNLRKPMQEVESGKTDTIRVERFSGFESTLIGTFQKDELYMRLRVLETETYLYQILIWTSLENRGELQPVMDRILESFKEFPQEGS